MFDRCREVQASPDGRIDLWSREHYKSTIITFAKTIQDILSSHGEDPLPHWGGREATFGIFSFNRPGAKKFLEVIKTELENNEVLKENFDDILYEDPVKQSPKWSLDEGIEVKRKSNQREKTVEAWGLVDSMPTGSHFLVRIYDDVITERFARSPDMVKKATESWELSLSLGARGGYERYIGTRYHFNDTYREIIERGSAKPRIYPATDTGTLEGNPHLLSKDDLAKKRRDMGPYTFSCQMMQNPKAEDKMGFQEEWLRHYDKIKTNNMNLCILVDPANEKKKKSDFTSMFVVGVGEDENIYVLEMVRDKLSLTERTDTLFELHKKWKQPKKKLPVYYEKYGKDSDIEHIKSVMDGSSYRFTIFEVGGVMAKNDRIRRIVPSFESEQVFLPRRQVIVDSEGRTRDLVREFINEEYLAFPFGEHDDMMDCLSRIKDTNIKAPQGKRFEKLNYPKINVV